jgi:hypothetical protein
MLQDVGVVTRVKGVAVAKHGEVFPIKKGKRGAQGWW